MARYYDDSQKLGRKGRDRYPKETVPTRDDQPECRQRENASPKGKNREKPPASSPNSVLDRFRDIAGVGLEVGHDKTEEDQNEAAKRSAGSRNCDHNIFMTHFRRHDNSHETYFYSSLRTPLAFGCH